jgi:hypothetical protein
MAEIERIPGARIVDIEARLVGQQAIVRFVVDAFERKGRTEFVALGGVIVNDVEDHLEAAVVKAGDHFLEFAQ